MEIRWVVVGAGRICTVVLFLEQLMAPNPSLSLFSISPAEMREDRVRFGAEVAVRRGVLICVEWG